MYQNKIAWLQGHRLLFPDGFDDHVEEGNASMMTWPFVHSKMAIKLCCDCEGLIDLIARLIHLGVSSLTMG